MSHAIRTLEDRLGEDLFDRQGRGVLLTPAGQAFAARVRLGLALITDAFGETAPSRSKRFVVSTLPSIATRILLPALNRLRDLMPDVAMELRLSEALEPFRENTVDVAVRFGPGNWPDVAAQSVSKETLFPVCSPAFKNRHRLARLEDVFACPLIAHPTSSWKLWFDAIGRDFNSVAPWLILDDAGAALDAAILGHGVALARGKLARNDISSGRLVRLFEYEAVAEYQYYCVSVRERRRAVRTTLFSEWLTKEMADENVFSESAAMSADDRVKVAPSWE